MREVIVVSGLLLLSANALGSMPQPTLVVLSDESITMPDGGPAVPLRSVSTPSIGPDGAIGFSGSIQDTFPGRFVFGYIPSDATAGPRALAVQEMQAPGLVGLVFRPDVGPLLPDENGNSFYGTHFLFPDAPSAKGFALFSIVSPLDGNMEFGSGYWRPDAKGSGLVPSIVSQDGVFGVGAMTPSGDVIAPFDVPDVFTLEPDDISVGIVVERDGAVTRVLGPGDQAPDTTGVIARIFPFVSISGTGRVAARIDLRPGVGGVTGRDFAGVWGGPIEDIRLIAREDDLAPDLGGAVFDAFRRPVTNGAGDVVFVARFLRGPGVVASNNTGVWRAREGAPPALVLREGDPAPGAGGAVFGDLIDARPFAGADDTFLVLATLAPGPGVAPANNECLWLVRGDTAELLAREGDPASGTSGAVYDRFVQVGGVDTGEYAFLGTLRRDIGGVNSQNDVALWGVDAAGGIRLVQRTGDRVPVENAQGATNKRTVDGIGFLGNDGIANNGWLGYATAFTDGSSAVYRTRLGEPGNACSADFGSDGDVDIADFGVFGAAFNAQLGDDGYTPAADIDADGDVDLGDFGLFGAQFGRTDCND
ncbi:MAG: choice-of-anchor tandem repeat NxxGxxAF-containing protein [Planctomycetota bacterium]